MSEKSFFGMSGHYHVLSLFLRRGYNVAVPVVDVGDDAILINDAEHSTRRLQVKSGNPGRITEHSVEVAFYLSRKQLREPDGAPLFYMLMAWMWDRWSWVLIPRADLQKRKERAERPPAQRAKGRPRKRDVETVRNELCVTIKFSLDSTTGEEQARLWGEPLTAYLNHWPTEWPDLLPGHTSPGSRKSGRRRNPPEDPAPAGAPATTP